MTQEEELAALRKENAALKSELSVLREQVTTRKRGLDESFLRWYHGGTGSNVKQQRRCFTQITSTWRIRT
jgi:hypothetical protein